MSLRERVSWRLYEAAVSWKRFIRVVYIIMGSKIIVCQTSLHQRGSTFNRSSICQIKRVGSDKPPESKTMATKVPAIIDTHTSIVLKQALFLTESSGVLTFEDRLDKNHFEHRTKKWHDFVWFVVGSSETTRSFCIHVHSWGPSCRCSSCILSAWFRILEGHARLSWSKNWASTASLFLSWQGLIRWRCYCSCWWAPWFQKWPDRNNLGCEIQRQCNQACTCRCPWDSRLPCKKSIRTCMLFIHSNAWISSSLPLVWKQWIKLEYCFKDAGDDVVSKGVFQGNVRSSIAELYGPFFIKIQIFV